MTTGRLYDPGLLRSQILHTRTPLLWDRSRVDIANWSRRRYRATNLALTILMLLGLVLAASPLPTPERLLGGLLFAIAAIPSGVITARWLRARNREEFPNS